MPCLPNYADLTKTCKDVFSKGYHVGKLNVDTKTQTCYGTEVSTNTFQKLDDKTVTGEIQVKNAWKCYGLESIMKWNTKNLVSQEISCADYLTPGLKVGVLTKYNIDSGVKEANIKGQFKVDNATVNVSADGGDESNVVVGGSIVVGYKS
jgi:hypothetical protein